MAGFRSASTIDGNRSCHRDVGHRRQGHRPAVAGSGAGRSGEARVGQAAAVRRSGADCWPTGDRQGRGGQLEPDHIRLAPLRRLDLWRRVHCSVRGRAPGGVGVRLGGASGQVSAAQPRHDDAAAVRDAWPRSLPDGGEDPGRRPVILPVAMPFGCNVGFE